MVKWGSFDGRFWWLTFSLPKLKEGAAEKLKMLQAMRGKSLIAKKKGEKDGGGE